ncbi:MAG: SMC family ATPase, partial [Thermoflexia bacterium]
MIPYKLRLTNFMPYRQAELDFTGIHVACLSGENGAGKSALLDAITWALWGRARARRDDDLIRQGAEEMEVEFTFRLGDDLYRVIRRRRGGKRGSSVLDLQAHDHGRWRSLAESTIPATEKKIARILHLDYDTFINSAFLRQGRADEFTIKTPAERKRVLSDILGLDIWQEYEERAKARLDSIRSESRLNEIRLEEIEKELNRRPEYEAQVEEAQREAEQWEAELRRLRQAREELERLRGEYHHVRKQQEEAAERVARARQELDALEQERREREARLQEYRALLEHAEEIRQGYAAYQAALEEERALSEKLAVLSQIQERRSMLEAEISRARHDLELQREGLFREIQMLRSRLAPPELFQKYQSLQATLASLNDLRQQHAALREALGQMALEITALQTRNQALREEMAALKEQMSMLEGAGAVCPLCRRPLSEHDRTRLLEEIQQEGRQKGDTYRANKTRLENLIAQLKQMQEQARANEARLEDLPRLEREAATLAERLRESEEAARQL